MNKVEVNATDVNGGTLLRKDVVETVILKPHVEIEKWASDSYAEPGSTVEYTIRVRNTDTGGAKSIVVTDTWPVAGLTYDFAGAGGDEVDSASGDCVVGDITAAGNGTQSGTFTLPVLEGSLSGDGEYCQFTYTVRVANTVTDGLYMNLAEVNADDFDDNALQEDVDEQVNEK